MISILRELTRIVMEWCRAKKREVSLWPQTYPLPFWLTFGEHNGRRLVECVYCNPILQCHIRSSAIYHIRSSAIYHIRSSAIYHIRSSAIYHIRSSAIYHIRTSAILQCHIAVPYCSAILQCHIAVPYCSAVLQCHIACIVLYILERLFRDCC